MAKFIWQARVFAGGPLFAASTATQVTVIDKADDTLASLWSDEAGTTPKANPYFISAAGKIEHYLDPGKYRVTADKGGETDTWGDVLIIDPDAGGGGGVAEWGDITGTLSAQTDLQTALDAKAARRDTVTDVTSSSGVVTINYAMGDYFTLALSENVTSWVFTNLPGSGKGASIMIRITQDSTARTVAWPASFAFTYGSEESVPVGSGDVALLAISTLDNGTKWFATMASES